MNFVHVLQLPPLELLPPASLPSELDCFLGEAPNLARWSGEKPPVLSLGTVKKLARYLSAKHHAAATAEIRGKFKL